MMVSFETLQEIGEVAEKVSEGDRIRLWGESELMEGSKDHPEIYDDIYIVAEVTESREVGSRPESGAISIGVDQEDIESGEDCDRLDINIRQQQGEWYQFDAAMQYREEGEMVRMSVRWLDLLDDDRLSTKSVTVHLEDLENGDVVELRDKSGREFGGIVKENTMREDEDGVIVGTVVLSHPRIPNKSIRIESGKTMEGEQSPPDIVPPGSDHGSEVVWIERVTRGKMMQVMNEYAMDQGVLEDVRRAGENAAKGLTAGEGELVAVELTEDSPIEAFVGVVESSEDGRVVIDVSPANEWITRAVLERDGGDVVVRVGEREMDFGVVDRVVRN